MDKLYKNFIRVNTVSGVNKLLQRVINALIQDEITESKAKTIGYLANIMLKGLEVGELEDRINKIELDMKSQEIRRIS
ncbi:MAG: hypothetical protein SA378_05295 [Sedimentibacter sp.]|jgi:uncharacterized small protein (DUF1192 family)|uniref:hypothetical protein n=1 Tax=Sedimentibacter sp. TaxID=1960295 RepID=UPI0029821DA9|nr:hypothetical protein [Sedimentibacter sp.]MDW5299537.1 hypothetical protein [Sedimentibacter sp.]